MNNCETCINNNGAKCVTMTSPDSLLRCYMTKGQRIAVEKSIIKFAAANGDTNSIALSKRIIKKLGMR